MKITVKNMSCQHCEQRIKKLLSDHQINASINLKERHIILVNELDYELTIKLLNEAGYQVI
jgi:copper chaperone CopZ